VVVIGNDDDFAFDVFLLEEVVAFFSLKLVLSFLVFVCFWFVVGDSLYDSCYY